MNTKLNLDIDGKKLKKILENNNIMQRELCDMLNCSEAVISTGICHNKLNLFWLRKIEDLFNLKENSLLKNPSEGIPATAKRINGKIHDSNNIINWNTKYFKKYMAKNKLFYSDLADIISSSTIGRYNSHTHKPSIDVAYAICKRLKCNPELLLGTTIEQLNMYSDEYVFKKDMSKEDNDNNKNANVNDNDVKTVNSLDVNKKNITNELISNKYKPFEDNNVINNISIINENLLMLVNDLGKSNAYLLERIDALESENKKIIDILNKKISTPKKLYISKTYKTYVCSEDEIKKITKSTIDTDDFKTYKDKVFKIVNYVASKNNLTTNNILHDTYTSLNKIYGFNVDELRKESNTEDTCFAIYNNQLCRSIYFNMLSDKV